MSVATRVTRAADLRELPLIGVLVVLLLAEGQWGAQGRGISPQGVLATLVATAPLLWRTRAPFTVLCATVVGVVMCLLTLKPAWSVVAAPAVAVYTVALHGDRVRSLGVAVIIAAVTAAIMVTLTPHGPFSTNSAARLGLMLFALVVGDAVRSRRTVRQAGREREADRSRRRRAVSAGPIAAARLRIAQEVHDVVAHAMVAINVQAGVAAHLVHKRPGQAETALTEIKRVSGTALADLRATLGLLRDPAASAPVTPTRQLSEVADLAAPLQAAGVSVDVEIRGNEERVPSAVGAAGYRIVQEALTNVLRHADASSAAVRVLVGARSIDIDVRDDGAGSAPAHNGAGTGLRGMAERAEALGGRIEAGRAQDGGWRVHAVLPIA
jgi:signal transduction histidine kinase